MELNHKIIGEGEPIILMHGLFGMLDNWQSVAKELSKDFMVIMLDLRNHGKSPHTDEWSIALMADDVRQFMEDNWIHNAAVLGHSMGGKVAMELALTEPDMVDKLIVVDIGPKAYQRGHEIIFEALNAVPIDKIMVRSDAEEALSNYITEPGIRLFLLKNISRKKEGGYQWKMNLKSITKHYDTIIAASRTSSIFEGESLFIKGENSDYIQQEDEVLIRQLFPRSSIITISGAGHWVHADNQDDLVEQVKNFMLKTTQ